MFGQAFGHTRFSLGREDLMISSRAYMSERLFNLSTMGKDIPIVSGAAYMSERIRVVASAGFATLFHIHVAEALKGIMKANGNILIVFHTSEDVQNKAVFVKNMEVSPELSEKVDSKTDIRKDMYYNIDLTEALESSALLGKDFILVSQLAEIINGHIVSGLLDTEDAVINVTIPPGGKLVIDTANYEVYLNNNGVLHLYEGDWPTIDRDTVTLSVGSGISADQLTGTLTYLERYL